MADLNLPIWNRKLLRIITGKLKLNISYIYSFLYLYYVRAKELCLLTRNAITFLMTIFAMTRRNFHRKNIFLRTLSPRGVNIHQLTEGWGS